MPRTILLVPCFNEESRFRPEAFRTFTKAWPGGVFLFVDDGSTDNTIQLLYALQEPIPRSFEVLDLAKSVGKAEAVRNGFQRAFRSTPDHVAFGTPTSPPRWRRRLCSKRYSERGPRPHPSESSGFLRTA